MSFESFYWRVAGLSLADRGELAQLEDERLSIEQRKATLIRMLRSASVALRGIALDFYCLANANLRHGPEPMIDDAVEDAVRASALDELERPPYESTRVPTGVVMKRGVRIEVAGGGHRPVA